MPTGVRKCKVCGCEYAYCKTNRSPNIFRYQDVACSPEHGSIYFAQIKESRSEGALNSIVPNAYDDPAEFEDDEFFEDEFDDDAEEPEIETK